MNKIIIRMYLSFLVCSLMTSCVETTNSAKSIKCDVDNTQSISESALIGDVNIISLQDSSATISSVNKVICIDSILYILDDKSQCLYLYKTDGAFLRAISDRGRASNEYLNLNDFFIDNVNGNINLVSQLEQKMLVYNHDATEFIETQKLPGKFARMECVEGGYIGYRGNYRENEGDENFCIMGRDMRIKDSFSKINSNREYEYHAQTLPFSTYKGKVYFHNDTGLDIYGIGNADMQPSLNYVLNCGEHNTPSFTRKDMDDFGKMMELYNNYVMNIYQFQETNRYLLFLFLYQGIYCLNKYDKSSGESETLTLDYYIGKYFFNFGRVVGMTEDCIYSIVDANLIYAVWMGDETDGKYETEYPQQVQRLREKFEKVDPEGNPFLVTYHIR